MTLSDTVLPREIEAFTATELNTAYRILEGRARIELDTNFGASNRLAALHTSMHLVADTLRTRK